MSVPYIILARSNNCSESLHNETNNNMAADGQYHLGTARTKHIYVGMQDT